MTQNQAIESANTVWLVLYGKCGEYFLQISKVSAYDLVADGRVWTVYIESDESVTLDCLRVTT